MLLSVSLALSIQGNWLFLGVLLLVAILISIWYYRRTLPPISKGLRIFLGSLRAFVLILLALLLFHPVLHVVRHFTQKPDIAVLVDTSRSLTIRDGQQPRSAVEKKVLQNTVFKQLGRKYRLHYFQFWDGARPLNRVSPDSLRYDHDGTDLTKSLLNVRKTLLNGYFSAVVLITDGLYNVGENPIFLARKYGVPIFTVGIGDSTEKKDILIERLVTNSIVYTKNKVPVDVVVSQNGFDGKKISILLKQGSRRLDTQTLTLGASRQEQTVRLYFTPQQAGFQKYSVVIPAHKGEFTVLNNRRTFYVKVLKSKLKVLILAGGPSPDVKFIRNILQDDENIEPTVVAQRKQGGVYVIPSQAKWKSKKFDTFFLVGFPRWPIRGALKRLVEEKILAPRASLLFVEGENLNLEGLRTLQPLLPFQVNRTPQELAQVYFQLTPEGQSEDILRVGEGLETTTDLWNDLPPVDTYLQNFLPLPDAKILGRIDPGRSKLPPNDSFRKPLLILRTLSGQKSIALLFENVWRWDLMMWGVEKTNVVLSRFLTRAARWLSTREESKPVQLKTDKAVYRSGETVTFIGQVYDKALRPIDNAEFEVRIKMGKDTLRVSLENLGNGKYEGKFSIPAPGTYRYLGIAKLGKEKLGTAKGKFSAGEFQIEFLQNRMNQRLLRQLSAISGGKFYLPDQVGRLSHDLNLKNRPLMSESEYNLWNVWLLLVAIILLLTIEWSIRRRKGLL